MVLQRAVVPSILNYVSSFRRNLISLDFCNRTLYGDVLLNAFAFNCLGELSSACVAV